MWDERHNYRLQRTKNGQNKKTTPERKMAKEHSGRNAWRNKARMITQCSFCRRWSSAARPQQGSQNERSPCARQHGTLRRLRWPQHRWKRASLTLKSAAQTLGVKRDAPRRWSVTPTADRLTRAADRRSWPPVAGNHLFVSWLFFQTIRL